MTRVGRFGMGVVIGGWLVLCGLWAFVPELFEPVAALAQTVPVKSPPTAARLPTVEDVKPPLPIRITATVDGTMLNVTERGATLSNAELVGWYGPGQDGRCVVVWSPDVTLTNITFAHGNDDALGFVGDCHGSLVTGCRFPITRYGGKSLIGYTNQTASNLPGPIYGAADGYACTYMRNEFDGSVRLRDGVWCFYKDRFIIGALHGVSSLDARINFTWCEWIAIEEKHKDIGYWYQRNSDGSLDPCGVRVEGLVDGHQAATPLKSRLYFANCSLRTFKTWNDFEAWKAGKIVPHTVIPADGPTLCRAFPDAKSIKAGRTAYKPKGSVPSSVFVKEPLSK